MNPSHEVSTATGRIGDSDHFGRAELAALADGAERSSTPVVSIYVPTQRTGPEAQQGSIILQKQLTIARRQLGDRGMRSAAIDDLLAPARELVGDRTFWQHQSDGLAVFCVDGTHFRYRVPIAVPTLAVVAERCHIRPLLPLLAPDDQFLLLALSQKSIRLFHGRSHSIVELDIGATPSSLAAALEHEDPEKQLQVRSVGRAGAAQFHGHGGGWQDDKAVLERYFRAVDHGLSELPIDTSLPLVLAGVAYYGPIYRSVSRHPDIVHDLIAGNPDDVSSTELHRRATAVIAPRRAQAHAALRERYARAASDGLALAGTEAVSQAAREGRVEILLLPPERAEERTSDGADPLDELAHQVLRMGGEVEVLADDVEPRALLRYA